MRVLVTGCYGFLGHAVCHRLISDSHDVTGTDRILSAISEKTERIESLKGQLQFVECDIANGEAVRVMVAMARPDVVIHLAAQYPVKHTSKAVERYVASNVTGWLNVAEACRLSRVPKMIYASSVVAIGKPASLYAATKMFNDLAAQVYARQQGVTMIGLQYAAIYGPRIRPDAVPYRIGRQILAGVPIRERLEAATCMVEISDAVEVTVRFVTGGPDSGSHVYLVAADDDKASGADVAVTLAHCLNTPAILPDGFERAPRSGRPNLSPLRDSIGFVPGIKMVEGMGCLAEWLKGQA